MSFNVVYNRFSLPFYSHTMEEPLTTLEAAETDSESSGDEESVREDFKKINANGNLRLDRQETPEVETVTSIDAMASRGQRLWLASFSIDLLDGYVQKTQTFGHALCILRDRGVKVYVPKKHLKWISLEGAIPRDVLLDALGNHWITLSDIPEREKDEAFYLFGIRRFWPEFFYSIPEKTYRMYLAFLSRPTIDWLTFRFTDIPLEFRTPDIYLAGLHRTWTVLTFIPESERNVAYCWAAICQNYDSECSMTAMRKKSKILPQMPLNDAYEAGAYIPLDKREEVEKMLQKFNITITWLPFANQRENGGAHGQVSKKPDS